uniref:Uncharacterized protein n=1 Tax=Zea mays TaxID=4577 RepID=C4IYT6_MAIZE|nr:unknown [Zea mays]
MSHSMCFFKVAVTVIDTWMLPNHKLPRPLHSLCMVLFGVIHCKLRPIQVEYDSLSAKRVYANQP